MRTARRTRWRSLIVGWRLVPTVLGLAVLAAVGPVVPQLVDLPQLLVPASYRAPTAVVASLLAALIVLTAADEPVDQLGASAPKPLSAARACRMSVLTVLAVASLATADHDHVASTALSVATLVGEGLLLSCLEPDLAWALPTLHLLAAATFGVNPDRQLAGWAWILRTDVTPGSLIASALVFSIGLRLHARYRENH